MKHAMQILALAAGILATESEAVTNYHQFHGNSCHSTTPGLTGAASQYGLGNPSATQALVVACPFTVPYKKRYIEAYISLSGFDRHADDNISCTMNFTSPDGYGLKSVTTATKVFDLWNITYGNGVRVSPAGDDNILWVSCRIPPTDPSGWMSLLTSVYMSVTY